MLKLNKCGRTFHIRNKSCILRSRIVTNTTRFASTATSSPPHPVSSRSLPSTPFPSVAYPNPFSHPELFDSTLLLDKFDKSDLTPKEKKSPNKSEKVPTDSDKKDREKKDIDKKDEKKDEKKDITDKSAEIKESIDPNSPVSSSGSGISSINDGGNNSIDNNNGDGGDNGSKGDKPLVNTKTGLYTPFLAIPMKDRPCLPGRYCTITVTDPEVIRCLQEVVETKEPYFVLFHVRDPNDPDAHIDVIKNKEFVHEIGTLCQIAKVTPRVGTCRFSS